MHKLEGIPHSELQAVIGDLALDGSRLVTKYQSADGTWTIVVAPPGFAWGGTENIDETQSGLGNGGEIAWGKKTDALHGSDFKVKVKEICADLNVDPSYLMAVMAFETGRTFSPSIKNFAGSGAVGLIQFMPSTAISLGTSTAALQTMTALAQLAYVKKYFQQWTNTNTLATLSDTYMAVLYPAAIGKPESHVLFKSGTTAYTQNKGLDVNDDGKITKAEASHKVQLLLTEGMRIDNLG